MQKTKLTYFYFAAALCVWIYLMLRAWFITPVHDEAATFFHYINHGEFLPGSALFDANNHILNSFLSKFFVKAFGIHPFTIRLANLLFFPMYVWFIYKLSVKLKHERMKILLMVTALSIHGFIEYFAYSRGYGMSMGILTAALYYSYRFFSEKNIHLLLPAIAFYWLATLSNLTLQNTSLMFLGLSFLYVFANRFSPAYKILGCVYIFLSIASFYPFVNLSLEMKKSGLLYYAAGEDFWTAVITSFTQMFFESKNILLKIFWIIWTGIFGILTGVFLSTLKNNWQLYRGRLLFPLLFFGNLFAILAMHFLMDVNYPSDRTGMHLVLYLFIGGVFLADTGKLWQQIAICFPTIVFMIQFVFHTNISYSTYWKNEHLPERFWNLMQQDSKGANPTIGGYRIRNLVWAWHNFQHGGELQNLQYTNYYNGFEDYQVFSVGDYTNHKNEYDSLDIDEISGVIFAKRHVFLEPELYLDSTGYATPENYTGEYFNLFETTQTDSFINHSWLVEADIKLYSLVTPPKINFTTTASDKDGNILTYENSQLHWLKKEFRPEDKAITVKLWWYNVPPETKRIVVYLWNIDQDAYTLQDATLRILKVK